MVAAAARPTARRCSPTPGADRLHGLPYPRRRGRERTTTGPNLDEVVPDLSDAEIKESIQDPEAKITEGFQGGLMPPYGDTLSEEQVDALVTYLKEVAGQ